MDQNQLLCEWFQKDVLQKKKQIPKRNTLQVKQPCKLNVKKINRKKMLKFYDFAYIFKVYQNTKYILYLSLQYKIISMNKSRILKAQNQYVSSQEQFYEKVLEILSLLIKMDESILSFLPQCEKPEIDTFWTTLVTKKKTREQKMNILASAFFRLQSYPLIDEEFNKFLKCGRIPKSVQLLYRFKNLHTNLKQKRDLIDFNKLCQTFKSLIPKGAQLEQIKEILLWKVEGCLLIINRVLKRVDFSKDRVQDFIKKSRKLASEYVGIIQMTLKIFDFLLSFPGINEYKENNNYLELQLRIIIKKYGYSMGELETKTKQFLQRTEKNDMASCIKRYENDWENNNIKISKFEKLRIERKKFHTKLAELNQNVGCRKNPFKSRKKDVKSEHVTPETKSPQISEGLSENRMRFGIRIIRYSQKKKILQIASKRRSKRFTKRNLYKLISDDVPQEIISTIQLEDEIKTMPTFEKISLDPIFDEIMIGEKEHIIKVENYLDSTEGQLTDSLDQFKLTLICFFGWHFYQLKITLFPFNRQFMVEINCLSKRINKYFFRLEQKDRIECEYFRKKVLNSELYFELIQEKTENKVQKYDIDYISSHLNYPKIEQIALFLQLYGYLKAYLFWYYTEVVKINGKVIEKRKFLPIKDSLKFSIALDFLRKHDYRDALKKMGNVRNKQGINECFKYLGDGRSIICKGFIKKGENIFFYCLKIEQETYNSFILRGSTSYFKKPFVRIYCYERWQLKSIQKFSLPLTQEDQTFTFLSNLVQNKIDKEFVKKILKKIEESEAEQFNKEWIQKNEEYSLKVPEEQQQKHEKEEIRNHHQKIASIISLITLLSENYETNGNLRFLKQISKIQKIEGKTYHIKEIYLECGMIISKLIKNCHIATKQFIHFHQEFDLQYTVFSQPYFNIFCKKLSQKWCIINQTRQKFTQKYGKNCYINKCRTVIKHKQILLFISLGWEKSLSCWRIDIYSPLSSFRYMSYFQEPKLDPRNNNITVWKKIVKSLRINDDLSKMIFEQKQINIYRTFGYLDSFKQKNEGRLEMIEMEGNLHYWIIRDRNLETGEVDENRYTSNYNIFIEGSSNETPAFVKNDILIRLYLQYINSNLRSYPLSIQFLH